MADTVGQVDAGVVRRRLASGPEVEAAVLGIVAEGNAFVLESTAPHQPFGRYTFLGFDPVATMIVDDAEGPGWLDRLAGWIGPVQRVDARSPGRELPFVGGWVGYLTYEAGALLESVPSTRPRDVTLPSVHFSLYDTVAAFDHQEKRWSLTAIDWPRGHQNPFGRLRPSSRDRLDALEARLRGARPAPPIGWSVEAAGEPVPAMQRDEYLRRVAAAKGHIEAGDIYQVNLTQRFTARTTASPVDLYRRLRVANPAALSALLVIGEAAVISSSPELFLDLTAGEVTTRPIKGTRPRVGDETLDAVRKTELLNSPKDRAELTMIVDLLRNDLGKVSQFGSVQVVSPGALEAHPTVFHLVATVRGRLRGDRNWADLLRASFPGGSITGTPKIRAMQLIDELETTERSVYCGSIGFIGLDGSMRLNIAIRTMIVDRRQVHVFAGGAIVADSDPGDEYEELLAKAAGMFAALRAGRPGPAAQAAVEFRSA